MDLHDEFWKFVYERQEIYHRRFVEKLPQSKWYVGLNPIFQKWKFCNIYPELDRGSQFIMNECNNGEYGAGEKEDSNLFSIVVYRLFNSIPAYRAMSEEMSILPEYWNSDMAIAALKKLRANGGRVFGGAFMITGSGSFKTSSDKIEIMCRDVIDYWLCNDDDIDVDGEREFPGTLEEMVNWKTTADAVETLSSHIRYCGEFLAYVMTQDLVRCKVVPFSIDSAYDIRWTIGAQKGLKLLEGASYSPKTATEIVKKMAATHSQMLPEGFKFLRDSASKRGVKPLGVLEIENSLCEFQKFYALAHPEMKYHAKVRHYVETQE